MPLVSKPLEKFLQSRTSVQLIRPWLDTADSSMEMETTTQQQGDLVIAVLDFYTFGNTSMNRPPPPVVLYQDMHPTALLATI